LEALWKLEGLRTEWHMELSAVDGNICTTVRLEKLFVANLQDQ